jgi:3-methyladenine DNA glycosylase/8-oxoguanine DNA glycosylase
VKHQLPIPHPYDFDRSMYRFRLFGDDLASRWRRGALHRVLRSGLAVRIAADGLTAYGPYREADEREVHHLLGGPFDLEGFAAAHPELAARAPGFRPPLLADPFEMLVTAVTAQQISLRAAAVMRGLLVQRLGEPVSHDGVEWWRFPRQDEVRGADLTGLKLSGMKMRTIAALAEADLGGLSALDDDGAIARLTTLPGVGRWTAEWFLARCLGRPRVVAAGDLGVRKAVACWFAGEAIWSEARVRAAMAPFGDHTNLAVHHMLTPEGG